MPAYIVTVYRIYTWYFDVIQGQYLDRCNGYPAKNISENDNEEPLGHAQVLPRRVQRVRVSLHVNDRHTGGPGPTQAAADARVAGSDDDHGQQVETDEDHSRVLPTGQERIVDVQREADAVAAVELAEETGWRHRDGRQDGTEDPDDDEDEHGTLDGHHLRLEGEGDGQTALDRHAGQYEDGHLAGQDCHVAGRLAGPSFHPLQGVYVVLVAEEDVVSGDHEKVDSEDEVGSCIEHTTPILFLQIQSVAYLGFQKGGGQIFAGH